MPRGKKELAEQILPQLPEVEVEWGRGKTVAEGELGENQLVGSHARRLFPDNPEKGGIFLDRVATRDSASKQGALTSSSVAGAGDRCQDAVSPIATSMASLSENRRSRRLRRNAVIAVEHLESRINLAATAMPTTGPAPSLSDSPVAMSATVTTGSESIAELTTSSAAMVAAFARQNRTWSTSLNVVVPSAADQPNLNLRATDGLRYWNGRGAAVFKPAAAAARLTLALGGQKATFSAGQPPAGGARSVPLAAAATNRVSAVIAVAGKAAGTAPPTGWYALSTRVETPSRGVSTPLTLVFTVGAVPAGSRTAALRTLGNAGPRPAEVTVGVVLRPPAVPSPLSPAPTPVATVAPPVVAAVAPVVASVAPVVAQIVPPPAIVPVAANLYEVQDDITVDTTLRAGNTYVITAEVHVRTGITLTIEDGVEVRIRNGRHRGMLLTACALIFDPGSTLRAQTVTFRAANETNAPVEVADNGGIFFLGGTRAATKDNVSSWKLRSGTSSFVADSIVTRYLGRTDPVGGDGDGSLRDDIDGVSVIGAVFEEWRVRGVDIEYSGDDGFDLTMASIAMESVRVSNPVEDGLNLTASTLWISRSLRVDMTDSEVRDREIFDFEPDGFPVTLTLEPGARVDIRGYWDNRPSDRVIDIRSRDMPRPSLRTLVWYEYHGLLANGQTDIFSIP